MSASRLIAHLTCRDAAAAVAFYARALGAETVMLLHAPDGTLVHGCLRIHGSEVFIGDTCGPQEDRGPAPHGAPQISLHLQVDDCDAAFRRAEEAGCTPTVPPEDMFWGDRYGMFRDPYGHPWAVATHQRVVDPRELEAALAKAMAAQSG